MNFRGKEYPIVCNMYVLFQFCKRTGENNLSVALAKLGEMGGTDGIKVDAVESWASILYEMLLQGAKENKSELDLTFEDCFETVLDFQLVEDVTKVIVSSMPSANGVRKDKKKAGAK